MNPFSIWSSILTLDLECDNRNYYGRFSSQFHPDNYIVAMGYSYNGGTVQWKYYNSKEEVPKQALPDLTGVKLIIGHNIKYDLLWLWDDPELQAFLKRGGEIYDTQYAEYLLGGMTPEVQMNNLSDTAAKYGGGDKLDAVKEMWNEGVLTSDIPKDLLLEYLVGSRDYGVTSTTPVHGDIMNTWLAFAGQMKEIPKMHPNFLNMLRARHDGLLGLMEMEYNGIYCDKAVGVNQREDVKQRVEQELAELNSHLPAGLPEEFKFNWGSPNHKSALFFGGTVTYSKWVAHLDENGERMYPMMTEKWPLFRGKPISPTLCRVSPKGTHFLPVPQGVPDEMTLDAITDANGVRYLVQDKVKSGKNRGQVKFRNVKLPNYDKPKGAKQDHFVTFPGYVKPDPQWQGENVDAAGQPLYSTGDKIIKKLIADKAIPFLQSFSKYQKAKKDMETYYWKENDKGEITGGMLTLVNDHDGIIHHSLNNTKTVTSRLSCSDPNAQNIPRGSKKADGTVKGSAVKAMFTSRFGAEGEVGEIDYSQLEVVCQGVLTKDKQLIADLNAGVDFHIKRLSAKLHRDYQELWELHHVHEDPDIAEERTKAKIYSFQSQYGAGHSTIAYDTGMHIDEVKALAAADEQLYPGVKPFYEEVDYARNKNSYLTGDFEYVAGERVPLRRGYWDSPTGTRYVWTQQEAPKFLHKKGTLVSFSPTELKNYPSQGLGGEIMQIMLGKVFRYFIANDRFGGLVLLVNTVHDCIWLDGVKQGNLLRNVAKQVALILECVPQVLNQLYGMDVPVPFPVEVEVGDSMLDMSVVHHK